MDITISHPDFKTQLLELRVSGYFHTPRILLNGVFVKRVDGGYTVLNDGGQEMTIRMNTSIFYRLPALLIDQDAVQLIGKSGWGQFAGWRNTAAAKWCMQSLRAALKLGAAMLRARRLNKST